MLILLMLLLSNCNQNLNNKIKYKILDEEKDILSFLDKDENLILFFKKFINNKISKSYLENNVFDTQQNNIIVVLLG